MSQNLNTHWLYFDLGMTLILGKLKDTIKSDSVQQ